jgi:hypothetical protein
MTQKIIRIESLRDIAIFVPSTNAGKSCGWDLRQLFLTGSRNRFNASSEGSSILSTKISPLLLTDSHKSGKGGRDGRDIHSQAGQEQRLCPCSAGDQVIQLSTA